MAPRPDLGSDGTGRIDVVCIASWNTDLVSRVARPPARGETLLAEDFDISPGGKGSNAAIACARQGARVALVARIGDDDFGRNGSLLWAGEGIDARHVQVAPGERSGVALILVYPDGDNSIAVAPGAGTGLNARHVEAASETIAAARVVMASCEVPLEATLAAFRLARAHGVRTLLNPAPAQPLPDEVLALTDVLTPNETELQALSGLPGATLEQGAQALLARGCGAVVATLGAEGCRLWQRDGSHHAEGGRRMRDVIDTVGAGDTFTGSLAAALARGEPLPQAVRWANAAAALSVTGRGAIGGMPTLARTRALLEQPPAAH